MLQLAYQLKPHENMDEARGGNFHAVKFSYDGIEGHFSLTPETAYLCVSYDISTDGLLEAILQNRRPDGTLDIRRLHIILEPDHLAMLDGLMSEVEEKGLPAGKELPEYLIRTQGRKFGDDFYAALERGLRLDGSEIQFGIPDPMGGFVGVLERRGYKPLYTERNGDVQIYARSIYGGNR